MKFLNIAYEDRADVNTIARNLTEEMDLVMSSSRLPAGLAAAAGQAA
jgi:hypothetical protein